MKNGTALNVDSGYLVPGFDLPGMTPALAIRRVTITSDPAGKGEGTLHFDPNACGLNEFGLPGICTKIAIAGFPTTVTLLKESEDRKLFSIEAKGYTGPPLRVVLQSCEADDQEFFAQLLVLDDAGVIQRIVSLKSAPHS